MYHHIQPIPIMVNEFAKHLDIKQKVLNDIASMGTHKLTDVTEQLSNSDWHLSVDYKRPYVDHLGDIFKETANNIFKTFNYNLSAIKSLEVLNYWFQQYEHGDFHNWHIHTGAMFSNIYYIELPDKTAKTSFLLSGNEFSVDVKEGDIITFPAFLLHKSSQNQGFRKTVIAFNI